MTSGGGCAWTGGRDSVVMGEERALVLAGESDAAAELAEPVEDTLFFAGEALAPAGEQGTVHGAIMSGT